MQTCIWPGWCYCHSLSLASVKSRLVLPFWYRLTRVEPEKRAVKWVCVCTKSKIIISIQWREVIRFDATWRINLPTLDLNPPFLKCQRMDWICIFMPAVWSHIKYTLTCSITSADLKHRTYNQAVMKNKHWTRKHSEECTPLQGLTKPSSNIFILDITGLRRITLLITQVCAERPVMLSVFSAFTTKPDFQKHYRRNLQQVNTAAPSKIIMLTVSHQSNERAKM